MRILLWVRPALNKRRIPDLKRNRGWLSYVILLGVLLSMVLLLNETLLGSQSEEVT